LAQWFGWAPAGSRAQRIASSLVIAPGGLQMRGELRQQQPVALKLEPQRAAQPQVVIDVLAQVAHRPAPPFGHG
jgi:hypothetical protein